jgi:DNA-binding NtrC family response regulator
MIGTPSETYSTGNVLQEVAKAKQDAERAAILAALKSTRWNRRHAAQSLEIDYKALLYKMKKLSIKKEPKTVVTKPAASESSLMAAAS